MKLLLLAQTAVFLFVSGSLTGEEEVNYMKILEVGYEHVPKGEHIKSIEKLQMEDELVAYFLMFGPKKEERDQGILISRDLETTLSATIKELEPFRYSPPKLIKVNRRPDSDRYNMPIISEEEYFKKRLEQFGAIQPDNHPEKS